MIVGPILPSTPPCLAGGQQLEDRGGVDLSLDDPRRQEIIDLVNAGRLDTPYDKSYNLADYDAIIASAAPAGNAWR